MEPLPEKLFGPTVCEIKKDPFESKSIFDEMADLNKPTIIQEAKSLAKDKITDILVSGYSFIDKKTVFYKWTFEDRWTKLELKDDNFEHKPFGFVGL